MAIGLVSPIDWQQLIWRHCTSLLPAYVALYTDVAASMRSLLDSATRPSPLPLQPIRQLIEARGQNIGIAISPFADDVIENDARVLHTCIARSSH